MHSESFSISLSDTARTRNRKWRRHDTCLFLVPFDDCMRRAQDPRLVLSYPVLSACDSSLHSCTRVLMAAKTARAE